MVPALQPYFFNIVEWRCKIHLYIGVDHTDTVELVFRFHFENIHLKGIIKHIDGYFFSFRQHWEITQCDF